jgi:hypothetical protein
MIESDDDLNSGDCQLTVLAELTEQITCRLEAGDRIPAGGCLSDDPVCDGLVRQLLPTLRKIISAGEKIGRDDRVLRGPQWNKKVTRSANPDVEVPES